MEVASRFEFAPPPAPGLLRSLGLALLAHALLLAALTWGVNWRSNNNVTAEAELWASVPLQAAPKEVEPPPEPEVKPEPAPPRVTPRETDAEIALAREKERKAKEKAEQEKREKERIEHEKKLAEEKKKKDQEAKLKEQQDAERLKKLREENLKRIAGMAGATGGPTATGTVQRAAGPSSNYAGRIRARIKPNIVFTEDIVNNPTAEVEVRTSPDGTIVGSKLIKSSGVPSWDEAVLKAIDKTEVLPRDIDGSVPSSLVISFRPKD